MNISIKNNKKLQQGMIRRTVRRTERSTGKTGKRTVGEQ